MGDKGRTESALREHLARLLTLAGLFLALSWAGLWLSLPTLLRAFGLALFAAAAIVAAIPLARFRWPTREDGLGRLDRGTGIRHRPATELTDKVSTQDPVALALWKAQRERTLASITRIRAGLPSPRLALHDPRALRALVMIMMAATWFAAGDERGAVLRDRPRCSGEAPAPRLRRGPPHGRVVAVPCML